VASADGILIVATNFRTLEVLRFLEEELRKPVVSSNQALMWCAHQMLRIPIDGSTWGLVPETVSPANRMPNT